MEPIVDARGFLSRSAFRPARTTLTSAAALAQLAAAQRPGLVVGGGPRSGAAAEVYPDVALRQLDTHLATC